MLLGKKRKYRVGYCGTPTRKDGIDDLLIAISFLTKKSNEIEFLIIGDFPRNSVVPMLKKKAVALGIVSDLYFTGLVPFVDIPMYLSSCDVLVLARPRGISAEAGFPTKLGEYMALKKAIVCTRVGDFVRYFESNNAVRLTDPNSPQEFADAIFEVIKSEEQRNKLSINGYNWALQNLEYKFVMGKLVQYLREKHVFKAVG